MPALCCERLHLEPQGGFYLACGYYYGENGETQDYAEAARWFEIAAGAGHVKAIDILKRVTAAKNAGNYNKRRRFCVKCLN